MLYVPGRLENGGLSQSAVRKVSKNSMTSRRPPGLLRGVVLYTYYVDDQLSLPAPVSIPPTLKNRNPTGKPPVPSQVQLRHAYCDVLVYSGLHGMKKALLHRCLVEQKGGGVHTGDIWVPRPSTINMQGTTLQSLLRINPGDLDGDHVLISFLDGDHHVPVITGSVPHPSRDKGNEKKGGFVASTRLVKPLPGVSFNLPRLMKHNGAVWGVDENGTYVLNTTRAHKGVYDAEGQEPMLPTDPPNAAGTTVPTDGSSGNVQIFLRADQKAFITVLSDAANPLDPMTEMATLQVEDGAITAIVKNKSDPSAEPTFIVVEDQKITLQTKNTTPSQLVIEPTKITVDPRADTGTSILMGVLADLQTDRVNLGDGAIHPVIWGDAYNSAHQTMDGTIAAFFQVLNSALTALQGALPTATAAPAIAAALTAFAAALLPATTPVAPAINTFDTAATNALSPDVNTR